VKYDIRGASKTFYMKGVDMRLSFDSLKALAKQLGANLEEGDLIIVDNERGSKRKALKVTKNGAIIIYAEARKGNEFLEINTKAKEKLLEYF